MYKGWGLVLLFFNLWMFNCSSTISLKEYPFWIAFVFYKKISWAHIHESISGFSILFYWARMWLSLCQYYTVLISGYLFLNSALILMRTTAGARKMVSRDRQVQWSRKMQRSGVKSMLYLEAKDLGFSVLLPQDVAGGPGQTF